MKFKTADNIDVGDRLVLGDTTMAPVKTVQHSTVKGFPAAILVDFGVGDYVAFAPGWQVAVTTR